MQAAQRLAPDAGETHLASALFYHYGNRESDHALAELEIAAQSLPNNAAIFRTSGLIERRLARWNEALRHFSRASGLDPRDRLHLANIAVTRLVLRHYAETERLADRGIADFAEAADDFWNIKAEAALAQGDLQRARLAIGHISSGESFLWLRFRLLFRERNYAEAERFSLAQWQGQDEESVRYSPNCSWQRRAFYLRGECLHASSRPVPMRYRHIRG